MPTLIKWNRQSCHEIASGVAAARQRAQDQASCTAGDEIAELTRKYDAVKQELLSPRLRDVPTSHLEQLAGEFRKRLESLNAPVGTTSAPASPKLQSEGGASQNEPSTPDSALRTPHFRTDPNLTEPQKFNS